MKLRCDQQFNFLLQEVVQCDQSLHNFRHHPSFKDYEEHLIKVFTRLMLEDNVYATVCWSTEHSGGGLLKPSDSPTIDGASMIVLKA